MKKGSLIGNVAQDLGLDLKRLRSGRARIVSGENNQYTELKTDKGILVVNERIDREELCGEVTPCSFSFEIILENPIELHRDQNDNPPQVLYPVQTGGSHVAEMVPRSADVGYLVTKVVAVDVDSGQNAWLSYKLHKATDRALFEVGLQNGEIRTIRQVTDKDAVKQRLTVIVEDNGQPSRSATVIVNVAVADSFPEVLSEFTDFAHDKEYNDNLTFYLVLALAVVSFLFITCLVVIISVKIYRWRQSRILYHSSLPVIPYYPPRYSDTLGTGTLQHVYNYEVCRTTDSRKSDLTDSELDRETSSEYNITVTCSDEGVPSLSSSVTLTLQISDVNDNAPVFERSSYEAYIVENNTPGLSIFTVKATDADWNQNARVSYILEDSSVNGVPVSSYVSVSADSGVIHAVRSFDYEHIKDFQFRVKAQDGGSPPLSSNVTVKILIQDQNDNPPQVLYPVQTGGSHVAEMVPRSADVGYLVTKVVAVDVDSGQNAWLSYKLHKATDRALFEVGLQNGEIRTIRQVTDKDAVKQRLTVIVEDNGQPSRSATVIVNVAVADSFPEVLSEFTDFAHDKEYNDNLTFYLVLALAVVSFLFITCLVVIISVKIYRWRQSRILYHSSLPVIPYYPPRYSDTLGTGTLQHVYNYEVCRTTDSRKSDCKLGRAGSQNVLIMDPSSTGTMQRIHNEKSILDEPDSPIEVSYSIPEEMAKGALIGNIAQDLGLSVDRLKSGKARIYTGNSEEYIELKRERGALLIKDRIDREALCSQTMPCALHFQMILENPMEFYTVTVEITDINDNPPIFERGEMKYEIIESSLVGARFVLEKAIDEDVDSELDRERASEYDITVTCSDEGVPSLSSSVTLTLQISDVNDNAPVFERSSYEAYIVENNTPGLSIFTVKATDADWNQNARVSYILEDSSVNGVPVSSYVSVSADSGVIHAVRSFDYEHIKDFQFRVKAQDGGSPPLSSNVTVKILIQDQNDNPPQVLYPVQTGGSHVAEMVPRSADVGYLVTKVVAVDVDSGQNAWLSYKLHKATDRALFEVGLQNGEIRTIRQVTDKDAVKQRLTVIVEDNGQPSRSATVIVNVAVADSFPEVLSEFTDFAHDKEYNDNLTFYLVLALAVVSFLFITCLVVIISVKIYRWRQSRILYHSSLPVIPYYPPRYSDTLGTGTLQHVYNYEVCRTTDSRKSDCKLGRAGSQNVLIMDPSSTGTMQRIHNEKSILDEPDSPLETSTNNFYSLVTDSELDRETSSEYNITVTCSDEGVPSLSSSVTLTLQISDVNDNAPVFERSSYEAYIVENNTPGLSIFTVKATDADWNQNARVSYILEDSSVNGVPVSSYVSVSADSGVIHAVRSFDYEHIKDFQFRVKAQDGGSPPLSSNVTIKILIQDQNDNPPQVLYPVQTGGSHVAEMVPRSADVGYLVTKVVAVDVDSGQNAWLSYKLHKATDRALFEVGLQNGEIRTIRQVTDKDAVKQRLTVIVEDNGQPSRSATVIVNVAVADSFPEVLSEFTDFAHDKEYNDNLTFYLVLALAVVSFLFITCLVVIISVKIYRWRQSRILYHSSLPVIPYYPPRYSDTLGTGTLQHVYNYEVCRTTDSRKSDCKLGRAGSQNVLIMDPSSTGTMQRIHNEKSILDEPDSPLEVSYSIPEEMAKGALIGNIAQDLGLSVDRLKSGKARIYTDSELDRERASEYNITVTCSDEGVPSLSSSVTLTLQISDVNDNAPVFERSSYEAYIVENNTPGLSIFTVKATDADWNQNARVSYILEDSSVNGVPVSSYVSVSADSGVIHAVRSFDYEHIKDFQFRVKAQDGGSPPLSSNVTVKILIQDQNDNPPQVLYPVQTGGSHVAEMVPRSADVGYLVTKVVAVDVDSGQNAWLSYKLHKATDRALFEVGLQNGEIRTIRQVTDKDAVKQRLTVIVEDNGQPSRSATVIVNMAVADSFPEVLSEFTDFAHDKEYNDNLTFYLVLALAVVSFLFITCLVVIISVKIYRWRQSRILYHSSLPVIPYYPPRYSDTLGTGTLQHVYNYEVCRTTDSRKSDCKLGRAGSQNVLIMDPSSTATMQRIHNEKSILDEPDSPLEATTNNFYSLVTDSELDRETSSEYNITVTCSDEGVPSLSSSVTLTLQISDVNDNAPVFERSSYEAYIVENNTPGLSIFTVKATDADWNQNARVSYILEDSSVNGVPVSSYVSVSADSGVIHAVRSFDYEHIKDFQFRVKAQDGGSPPLSSNVTVKILIQDQNDNPPQVLYPVQTGGSHVAEMVPRSADVGYLVTKVVAVDVDSGQNAWLSINCTKPQTGRCLNLVTDSELDRETSSEYNITVTCSDEGVPSLSSSVTLTLQISDVNDNAPVFERSSYEAYIVENNTPGLSIFTVKATDADWNQNARVSYILEDSSVNGVPVSSYVSVSADSGIIHAVRSFDYEHIKDFQFRVKAQDGGSPPLSSNVTVKILIQDQNDNPPQVLYPVQTGGSHVAEMVPRSADVGYLVTKVVAVDVDSGQNAWLSYKLHKATDRALFEVGLQNGEIRTIRQVTDKDAVKQRLTVIVEDNGQPSRSATVIVNVAVADSFPEVLSEFTDFAHDKEYNDNLTFYLVLALAVVSFLFITCLVVIISVKIYRWRQSRILYHSSLPVIPYYPPRYSDTLGTGTLQHVYNYEVCRTTDSRKSDCKLGRAGSQNVLIMDPSSTGTMQRIHNEKSILDEPDSPLEVSYSIPEEMSKGSLVGNIAQDLGILTNSELDRETSSEYNITVTCSDEGVPSLSSSVTLTLQISDVNDNAPVFERSSYEAYIVENNTPGLSIFTVKATDADWNQNARVSYILEDSSVNGVPVSSYVSVSADSGVIHAVRSFDYEHIKDFQFRVKAQDGGSPPLSSNVTVKILIQDQNDNPPQVLYPVQTGGSHVAEMVPRSADVGYLVTKVVAVDVDSGQNAWLSYKLHKATDRALFEVGLQNGEIRTIRQVTDKDAVKQRLTVIVEDNGQPSRSATVIVNVAVADSFPEVLSEFTDFAHDKEYNDNLTFYLVLALAVVSFLFITCLVVIISVKIYRWRQSRILYHSSLPVIPYYPPRYSDTLGTGTLQHVYNYEVCRTTDSRKSDCKLGRAGSQNVLIMDPSSTGTMQRIHNEKSILDEPDSPLEFSDSLVTDSELDRETSSEYNITVTCSDEGVPSLSSSVTLTLQISDVNDNAPVFERSSYEAYIVENNTPGLSIFTVKATDADWNQNARVSYILEDSSVNGVPVSSYVSVSADSGVIHAVRSFDYEHIKDFQFRVKAQDGGSPPLSSNVTVKILIQDQNDNPPQVLYPVQTGGSHVAEMVPRSADVGYLVTKVVAVDVDSGQNAWLSYKLHKATDRALFEVGLQNGEIRTIRQVTDKDAVKQRLTVIVEDNGQPSRSATVIVNVAVADSFPEVLSEFTDFAHDKEYNDNLTFYLVLALAVVSFLFITCLVVIISVKIYRWRQSRVLYHSSLPVIPYYPPRYSDTLGTGTLQHVYNYEVCRTTDSRKSDCKLGRAGSQNVLIMDPSSTATMQRIHNEKSILDEPDSPLEVCLISWHNTPSDSSSFSG
ncbi:hypothetical protein Q5P01_008956 [Channa striata]|uniref:Cadherin domain-containing protein n=1 Tax=Channa striata TaxID=64152 RepID=A0AA88ST63_CHASR|nr:hypothetical protein Q5P01_008956 [Channa striata]